MDTAGGRTPRRWNVKRILLGLVVLFVVAAVAWVTLVFRSFMGNGQNAGSVIGGLFNPRGQFPGKDRILILLAGKDYDHNAKDIASTKLSRSDTIMVISADLEGKKLSAVSIPRDMKVKGPDGKFHKINAMLPMAMGNPKLLQETIANYLGVQCDYYVILKDQAVKYLVDVVGGVDVNVLDNMFYSDYWGGLKIDLKKGAQHLNGDQAIGYVRFRETGQHGYDQKGNTFPSPHPHSLEEGDLRRTERQQALMRELMIEALKPANLLKENQIIDTGFSQIDTNLSRTQVLALANLMRGQSLGDSLTATLPGSGTPQGVTYFFLPDLEADRLMMKWVLFGDEASGRKLITISVQNGTKIKGAAKQIADEADNMGFTAYNGGNTKEPVTVSNIVFRKAAEAGYAQELGRKLGISQISKAPSDDSIQNKTELTVQLGPDIKLPK